MIRNIAVAMIMTIIIAITIEGTKLYKKKVTNKIEKDIETHKKLILDYVRCRIIEKDNIVKNDFELLNDNFASLVLKGYVVYIGKMAQSIVKTVMHYELEDHDEMVFIINGITNERNKQTIRKLIKQEINTTLKEDEDYGELLRIGSDRFDEYIDYTIEYIENEIEFQRLCGEITRNIMLNKY